MNHAGRASPILTVDHLIVTVGRGSNAPRIIDDLSLQVAAGETLCLVGESGSGKSVTSLAVMGLLPKSTLCPSSGSIVLNGENLIDASQRRLRRLRAASMAMIFQEPMTALNPVVAVGRQIEEVLREHTDLTAAERQRRLLDMIEQVHLADASRILGSFPHQLSGGQRQRIMIAMALILNPKLLIADEPTTALDVTTQKQILLLIRELQRNHGTAVLFVTHDMGVVVEIADRVAVMRVGRLVESGAVDHVLRAPKEDYTLELLRSVPSLSPRPSRADAGLPIVLETRAVGKTYNQGSLFNRKPGVAAISDVSLRLRKGRTLGIVGESGSGKTTVARCIIRLVDPTSGVIQVAGHDVSGLSRRQLQPHRRRMQIVFQDPNRSLNPRLTVGDAITEGPINFGASKAEALMRARALLELVQLPSDAVTRYPHEFSGGQRQRIAIARALAMEPELLVADEAVSALDVSVQAQVLRLFAEIQSRVGIALLFITHDLRVAAQICDDVVVMNRGRIVEAGPTIDVLARPSEPYTQQLLAAAPGRHWDFANLRPLQAGKS